MKKSIALTAILTLVSVSIFASSNPSNHNGRIVNNAISILPQINKLGVTVTVNESYPVKTVMEISNGDEQVIYKDIVSKNAKGERGYLFNELPTGDYTLKVKSKNQSVVKKIHLYDEEGKKTYFFLD